jgi:hypothetical protein
MAAVKPAIAIIFDIRRGNMLLQLMYKAIFELSKDRADFVSMLFAKPRPAGLSAKSTVADLFGAFGNVQTSDDLYAQNLKAIEDNLTKTHHLPLSPQDLTGVQYVYHSFYWSGFAVRPAPTYDELMMADDGAGVHRSYLASEANFTVLKQLQTNNLVVPVVGDFGGPKAIRAVAAFLKAHDAMVSAFYLSNVEQYLFRNFRCFPERRRPPARCVEHVHSIVEWRRVRLRARPRFLSTLGDMVAETTGVLNKRF